MGRVQSPRLCVHNLWSEDSTCICKRGFVKKISNVNKGNVSPWKRANLSSSIYILIMLLLIVSEYVLSLEDFQDSLKRGMSALWFI